MDLLITITPVEGRTGSTPERVTCFYEADVALHMHSNIHNAPERGTGYLKTAISVELDGMDYALRYDMVAGGADSEGLGLYPNLRKTLMDHLRFYAGERCPRHMTEAKYRAFLGIYAKDNKRYKAMLEKLEALQC